MSFLDQLKMKKALEERGRLEIEAKREAEDLISKVRASVDSSHSIGVDVSTSRSILELAEQQMVERDYRKALLTSRKALEAVESESQSRIMERYLHLRRIFHVSMIPEPPELEQLLQEGELAIALSIPRAVDISNRIYPAIRQHLLNSRDILHEKVRSMLPDHLEEERLSVPLNEMMVNEGDAESLSASINKVVQAVQQIVQERLEWLRSYHEKLSRFVGDLGYMDLIWNELKAHFKEEDFETVRQEMDLIQDGLDSQLEIGLPSSFIKARDRLQVLSEFGVDTTHEEEDLSVAEKKLEIEPLMSLEDYEKVMNRIQDLESDYIADMIQEIRDMITVGRHIGIDLGEVIVGLDEVRMDLRQGNLRAAVAGVEEVKAMLLERMGGYNELELAFFTLSDLVGEVEEYDLDLEEPMRLVNKAREDMSESGLEGSLGMVRETIRMIHYQAKELLGSKLILAQKSLQAGFRIDADVVGESERLGELFQIINEGRYRGMMREIADCRLRIEAKLKTHARDYLQSFLKEVEEREDLYDVKKMRLQAKGAEKLLNENSADESYRIVWTARRQLSNLDVDALEDKLKKVRELVSTGEAVEVDVSDLKRMMFSFSYDGKNVNLEAISQASELMVLVRDRINDSLTVQLQKAHIQAYQSKMSGYQTEEQLASLRKAFRLLEKGEFRSVYGALKEAEIGYNIQVLVHDEVYERLLRISSIIAQEGLNDRSLKVAVDLFHNGRYREADVESKKLLRSLIEQGLKSAAANIMMEGERLIETADMLKLKVVSLRESLPQAQFFLENGDYRNASSLMEKAMRTGRSEISRALQDHSSRIRPRIGEPMLDRHEKSVSLDMLGNARVNIEAGRYDVAANILLHLEEDLDKRAMLVNRCRMAQARASEFLGIGRMMDLDITDLEALAEWSEKLLQQGRPLLCHETLERLVDQIGDLIVFRIRSCHIQAQQQAEEEGLAGPDLDKLLSDLEDMAESVRRRRFHAAKEVSFLVDSRMEEIRIRRESMEKARQDVMDLQEIMLEEDMGTYLVHQALDGLDSCHSKGEFAKGALMAFRARLDIIAALGLHRQLKQRAQALQTWVEDLPDAWECPESLASIASALQGASSADPEKGALSFLDLEGDLLLERERRRLHLRESIKEGYLILGEQVLPSIHSLQDHDLQTVWSATEERLKVGLNSRMLELESALASSSWPNTQSRKYLVQAKAALESARYPQADVAISRASVSLGRDDASANRALKDFEDLRGKVAELREIGCTVQAWESFFARPPAHRISIDRQMSIISVKSEAERKGLVPRIETELQDGLLVVRNLGPGIAQDIRVDDRSIGYLGIGQSRSLTVEGGRKLELTYHTLAENRQRKMEIMV